MAPTCPTRVLTRPGSWIEGEAVRQLEATAGLPGMVEAVGLPDLHPGRGTPIGAAFATRNVVYPHLVGNDIGCGMALWATDLLRRKAKRDRWADKLSGLEQPWEGDARAFLEARGVAPTVHDRSLGTIGGGNHFAELQQVEDVHDKDAFTALGLDAAQLVLLVHSGSRGLGEEILRAHVERYRTVGLVPASESGRAYLAAHDGAVAWARANRALIAERFLDQLGSERRPILDIVHNGVSRIELGGEEAFLHRKGAAPADAGPVVIPGSRGHLSYLVQPLGDGAKNLRSLAHGAGRKWRRDEARRRVREKFTREALTQTELGSAVICEDRDLLYEEAPPAYKRIDDVIADLVDAGVARVIASFRPLITYKVRAVAED